MARVIAVPAGCVNRAPAAGRRPRFGAAPALALAVLGAMAMAGVARAQTEPVELAAEELYREVSPSVYLVAAAVAMEDIKNKKNINQGSAVAIGERELVTNCHVIKDKALIFLLRNGKARPATAGRADTGSDLCTLNVTGAALAPVAQIRSFASLSVGERVYTIGSPKGLENTLGGGLIAGLRNRGALKLVQITAPISQGSSGGGLFDRFGHLVGITSFFLNEAQSINFAVSMDNLARVASLPPAADDSTATALAPEPAPTARARLAKGFSLELVVARTDREAQQTWSYLSERYGDLLNGLKPETQRFDLPNKGTFYRLLAGVVSDRGRASALCREITQRGHATCLVR